MKKGKDTKSQSLWLKSWARFRHHKLAMFGLVVLGSLVILTTFAPLFSRYSPSAIDLRYSYSPPTSLHWLGTDGVGRDIWTRLLYGGRVSIVVGFLAVTMSMGIAIMLGGLAGYFGGWFDLLIMRFTDVAMSVPPLVMIITLVAIVGPSLRNTILAIGFLYWPGPARIVRGQMLSLREKDFSMAARSLGLSSWRIIFRHLLPNALAPIIVAATLQLASAILLEAALSFLGLGIQPPIPSWGNMLQVAQTLTILEQRLWMWLPPGLVIILCVLSVNFIGDGFRDALDPYSRW